MKEFYTSPSPLCADEIEVHLFGSGYGEALAIHLSGGKWLAIDSARTKTGRPWLLEYFEAIGVDLNDLIGLLITHWHTDHIQGASEILARSPNAQLMLSNGGKTAEFAKAAAELSGSNINASKAATNEMMELYRTLKTRKIATGRANYRYLMHNMVLNIGVSCTAKILSPSEADCAAALRYFGSLLSAREKSCSPFRGQTENHASVVVLLEIGQDTILLGGDRENHSDVERGWNVVIETKMELAKDRVGSAFKVAHHGSDTGFHDGLWPDHLSGTCVNIVTPYVRLMTPIPTQQMLQKYKKKSPTLVCTSLPSRTPSVAARRAFSLLSGPKIRYEGTISEGSVRLRKRSGVSDWEIELFGAARLV
jgi:hypothetical protein